jgi:hypothetical protein
LNRQSVYIAIINTLIGLSVSLLFKDNTAIVLVISGLVLGTILYIERKWIVANIFRHRSGMAIVTAILLFALFVAGFMAITSPQRKTHAAIRAVSAFLGELKAGRQSNAYNLLSKSSRDAYLPKDFISDHSGSGKVREFTIEQVILNSFDKNKARVKVSSPFQIFGHDSLDVDLVRESEEWRIVLSRKDVVPERVVSIPPEEPAKRPATVKPAAHVKQTKKKKDGAVTSFFKTVF